MRRIIIPILFLVAFCTNVQAQTTCGSHEIDEIVINNLMLEQGSHLQLNAVYRQTSTFPGVDALVKIVELSAGMSIVDMDYSGHGHGDAFQPIINKAGGYNQGFVDFQVSFVETATNLPTTLNHIVYSAIDIDGDNTHIKEFVELSNVSSFTTEQDTDLEVIDLGESVKFQGPLYSEEVNLNNTKISGTAHSYSSEGFNYRCGISGNNGNKTRHFALAFHCIEYQAELSVINSNPPTALCKNIEIELDDNGEATINAEKINDSSYSEVGFRLSIDRLSFDYTNIGDNQVELTVRDDYDREDNCTANVHVTNRSLDVVCPPDISTNTNSGCYRSGLDIGIPTITSNVPIFSIANDAPEQFFVGTTIVTWTVINVLAEVSTCQQTITIVDDITPVFVPCVPDVTVFVEDDDCDFGTLLQAPIVSDNCGIASLTSDTEYPLPLGQTSITWTVVDPSGLSATCTQQVNVIDNTDPVIICPSEVVLDSEIGACGVPGNLVPPTVSDPCGIASVTSDAPTTFPIGSTEVTWIVTDNNGNQSECTQTITVEDNVPPEITCPDNIEVTTAGSSEFVTVDQPTYSDDCGIASISNSFNNTDNASGVYPLGTTAILWTVTDNNGNTSTCIMTVTVTDTEAPPIDCPDDIDVNSPAGSCNANITIDIPLVEGGEVLASLTNDFNNTNDASGIYPIGETLVTWTGVDVNGNVTTCAMLVNVEDATPPAVTCPGDIDESASGSCDANVVNLGTPVVNDACGIATVESNAPATFPVGLTVVTWTVTDVNGNVSTCNQDVSLTDDTGPNVICPADIIASADEGINSAFVSIPLPNATDDCGIESYVNDYNGTSNASDVYPIGVTTIVWTVTDNNGNSSTCSMTVTIQDTEAPPITCPEDIIVSAGADECETNVIVEVPTYSDNDGIASLINDFNGTDNASGIYPIGVTTILWTVTDLSGNQSQCTMTVTVNDVTDPEVTCPDNLILDADFGGCEAANVNLTPPVVGDACGISSVTNNALASFPIGVTVVVWTVTDNNGNETTCSQNVVIEDNTAPEINCPANVSVSTDAGVAVAFVNVPLATATDDCGIESIVNSQTGTNDASGVYILGTTIVTWTATDVNGNSVSCTMTVTVSDGEAPEIQCPESPNVNAEAGLCEAFVVVDIPIATDNDGIASLTNDFNGTDNASGNYPVGVTNVIWTATDFEGNSTPCPMTVTVVDITPPSLGCQSDINATVDQGECGSASVALGNPSFSDECGIDGISLSNNAPDFYPAGQTTVVVWQISDINGNVAECSQEVTITDDEGPSIACPDDITVNTDLGVNTALVTVDQPTVSDNCGIESLTNDFNGTDNASGTYPEGITIVTWTVVDIYGNEASCSMTVNVIDSEGPVGECPDDVIVNAGSDECETFANVDIPVFTDNDGIASMINDFNGTDNASGIYPVGTTIVIWTITDNSGNSTQCSMSVTVNDVTMPTLECTAEVADVADEGACSATEVSLGGANVSDACGIMSIENNAPDVFQLGTTTFTWTVVDNSGNIATCETTVTITDDQSPVVECPSNVEVGTDDGLCTASGVDLGFPIASDNCDGISISNDAPDIFELGITTVTWTIVDNFGNATTCQQTVEVIDDDEPTILEPGDLIIDADPGTCEASGIVLDDLIAEDNCTGSFTITNNLDDFLPLPVGTTTITWTIIDANGNVTTITQDIIVEDNQAPEITCPEDQTVENEFRECWAIVEIEIPEVSDNCDVATVLNDYNNTTNATDTFYVGVTEVVWTVTDVNGNTSSCIQIITVLDTEDPSLACPPNVAVANDPGFCGAEVVVLEALASDNCEIDTLYNTYNNTSNASDYYPVGVTTITWVAQDINGNEFTCDMNVTVVDTELPVITCPADITANTDPGVCDTNLEIPQPVVTDNCDVVFVNDITNTDNASGVYTGVTTITWTATDASSNQATCEQIITIVDEELPIINCPPDITVNNDPGECGAVVTFDEITATDNCEVDQIILVTGVYSGDYVEVGDTTVTYEVSDVSGNTASCTFTITVNDIEVPTIICPETLCIEDSATVVEYELPEVNDNCSYDLVQIDGLASGSVFDHGETINTFIVTDEGGLTAECSFTILVDLPPVAVDDAYTMATTGGELELNPLDNDFDLDVHDSILVVIDDFTVSIGEAILIDEEFFIFNAPEGWCGLATIEYTITDEHGKKDDAVISIYVNCPEDLFIPEGISPDGDGSNDTFEIIGLWQYPNNKISVFNRWGHEVFQMSGYDNSWNGTSTDKLTLGNSPLPRGTYFYLLDLGNGEEPIKGFVYVLNR